MFLVIIFLLSILFLTSFCKEGFETSSPSVDVPHGYMRINDKTILPVPDGIDFSKVKYVNVPNDGILPFEHIEIPKQPDSNARVMVNLNDLSEGDQKKILLVIQSSIKPVYVQVENNQVPNTDSKTETDKNETNTSESNSESNVRAKQNPLYSEGRLTNHASSFPGNNKGFCTLPSIHDVNETCNNLSKNICASTSCCVLLGGEKCVAGSERGPTQPESYQGNKEFYYFQGQCYGNCI